MTDSRDDHAPTRRLLLPYLAGVLDDARAAEVRTHLEACAGCRTVADETAADREAGPEDSGHLPEEMIARWPLAARTLRGLERAMVRRHVERCASCRDELLALGHAPALPVVPDLEPADAPYGAGVAAAPAPPPAVVPRPAPARRPSRAAAWALGGWAGLATAAAVALAVNPGLLGRGPGRPPAAPAPALPAMPAPSPPAAPEAVVRDLSPPIELRFPARGAAVPAPAGSADASGRVVVVALPAQAFEPDEASRVTLEVLGPDGRRILSRVEDPASFATRRTLLLDAGGAGWAPGSHVLLLRIEPGPAALVREPETREFRFEVRAR